MSLYHSSIAETMKMSASAAPLGYMKALTVGPLFASLLMLNLKGFETRTWSTKFRGWFALHVANSRAKSIDLERAHEAMEMMGQPWDLVSAALKKHEPGSIIGVLHLQDVLSTEKIDAPIHERLIGHWERGNFAWKVRPVFELDAPIRAKGQLGLWNWKTPKGPIAVHGEIVDENGKKLIDARGWVPSTETTERGN